MADDRKTAIATAAFEALQAAEDIGDLDFSQTVRSMGNAVDPLAVLGEADAFIVGAKDDHLTPWKGCYETTQLLGGECTFALCNAGHIADLVNPPGNREGPTFRVGPRPGAERR